MSNPFAPSASEAILRGEPAINDDQRADIFDHFEQSASADELAQRIAPLSVPIQLKQKLYDAKANYLKPTEPVDKVVAALNRLKDVDHSALDRAENSPAALKILNDHMRS